MPLRLNLFSRDAHIQDPSVLHKHQNVTEPIACVSSDFKFFYCTTKLKTKLLRLIS
jgi:hypothetical protein